MGLIHAGDPERAADVGHSMAVAVAAALASGANIRFVIETVLRHAGSLGDLAGEFTGRMERLVAVAESCPDVFALREPFYREFLVTFPPWEAAFSLEMVPCALTLCLIAGGDAEHVIVGAANMGRDADTIASMAGEVCGALGGAGSLPSAWVETVLRANPEPDLSGVAADLCDVLVRRAETQRRTAGGVGSLR